MIGRGVGPGGVLGRRVLNRALLERQMLLRRWKLDAAETTEHLVGLQAQAPNPPYFGLWTRLDGFRPDNLARLISERRAVRIALMRSTIHLVTARDCLFLRPLVQPVLERSLQDGWGRHLEGLDLEAVAAAGRALLEERPRTPKELGKLLAEQWPDRDPAALANAVRALAPLVQVPPRGLWGASGPSAHTTAETWLARPLEGDPSREELVVRYLTAFGPASVADMQTWSGLTTLHEVTERLRPRLLTFRDEQGRELFDVADAPFPDPDTPAPPRFLPAYDNVLLSHADRTRIISDDRRRRIAASRLEVGTVLVDGFVAATWKLTQHRGPATLRIEPFETLSQADTAAVTQEGARLLAFAGADHSGKIQFERAGETRASSW
ncbi:MAG: winged helix DNA-binding domain-containing protein [Actinomycetota bacterium]|nr:winged helix DNA-binding domain-containing protein [Actinomycetota bacterium]